MTQDEIKAAVAEHYREHRERYISRAIDQSPIKGVMFADLSRNPVVVDFLSFDESAQRFDSVSFRHPLNTRSPQKTTAEIMEFCAAWGRDPQADWNEPHPDLKHKAYDVAHCPAAHIVNRLGLFGQAPTIGQEALKAFETKIERKAKSSAPELLEKVNREALAKAEADRLRAPMSVFGSIKLHKDCIKSLSALSDYDWRDIEFYGRSDERGLLRRQAAEIYPLLASFFANNSNFDRRIIQKKKPLNAELAAYFDIKEKSLKRLQRVAWSNNGLRQDEILGALSNIPPDWFPKTEEDWESFCILVKTIGRKVKPYLDSIAAPKSRDRDAKPLFNPYDVLFKGSKGQWREFHARCATEYTDDRPPQGLDPEFREKLKSEIDWKALRKAGNRSQEELDQQIQRQLGKFQFRDDVDRKGVAGWMQRKTIPDLSEHFMQRAAESTEELLQFLCNHVALPVGAQRVSQIGNMPVPPVHSPQRQKAMDAATRLLIIPDPNNPGSGKTAPQIFQAARAFLNDLAGINEKIFGKADTPKITTEDIPEGHWPHLFFGQIDAPIEGYYWEALTSPEELTAEGRGLHHCVGGYSGSCRGGQHILSLRRRVPGGFERIATLQILEPQEVPAQLTFRQFYADHDTRPSDEAHEMRDWLMQEMNNGGIPLNWPTIKEYQEARGQMMRNLVEKVCGYDWMQVELLNNAMFAIGRMVHKDITKTVRSAPDLADHDVMWPVISTMDPIYGAEPLTKAAPAP